MTPAKQTPAKTIPSDKVSYRLLAVDDNDLNLGLFRLFLTQLGHNVTSVNNPFDAIDLVKAQSFDLVFTDIQMPGMNGIEASIQMRRDGFTGPIIAITAHLSNLDEFEIDAAEVNDVLIKPVTKPDLNNILNLWLGENPDNSIESVEPSAYKEPSANRAPSADKEPSAYKEPSADREPSASNKASIEQCKTTAALQSPLPQTAPQQSAERQSNDIYDLALALERANHSKELATEMLHLLVESLDETLDYLSRHAADPIKLGQGLHKFAGGIRFSGAAQVEVALENLREKVLANDFSEADINSLKGKIQDLIEWNDQHPTPFD
tara:strand:- start:144 stop:1109 length:966 start_codon:yes stop_codon:yes gene_type:complete